MATPCLTVVVCPNRDVVDAPFPEAVVAADVDLVDLCQDAVAHRVDSQ